MIHDIVSKTPGVDVADGDLFKKAVDNYKKDLNIRAGGTLRSLGAAAVDTRSLLGANVGALWLGQKVSYCTGSP